MTKPVNPNTLCGAVMKAVSQLGKDTVRSVTGKSYSLAHAWGNPDLDNNIPAFQALNLDMACKEAGHGTPILDAMCHLIDAAPCKAPAAVSLETQVVNATGSFGRVADAVRLAQRDARLSEAEKHSIAAAAQTTIDDLRGVIDDLWPAPQGARTAGLQSPLPSANEMKEALRARRAMNRAAADAARAKPKRRQR